MGTITGRCDVCNEVFDGDDLTKDYDGRDLCTKCELELNLVDIEGCYVEQRNWLMDTHIKRLREMKKEITTLKKKLKIIQNDREIKPLKI